MTSMPEYVVSLTLITAFKRDKEAPSRLRVARIPVVPQGQGWANMEHKDVFKTIGIPSLVPGGPL